MPIDNDVKEILDKHDSDIQVLKIDSAETKQRLTALENMQKEMNEDIKEIKTVVYQQLSNNNSITNLLSQLITNQSKEKIVKSNNIKAIAIQAFISLATIAGAYFTVKPN